MRRRRVTCPICGEEWQECGCPGNDKRAYRRILESDEAVSLTACHCEACTNQPQCGPLLPGLSEQEIAARIWCLNNLGYWPDAFEGTATALREKHEAAQTRLPFEEKP